MGSRERGLATPPPTLGLNLPPEKPLAQLQLRSPVLPSSLPAQTGPAFVSGSELDFDVFEVF